MLRRRAGGERGRRAHRLVAVAEWSALAERRYPDGVVGPAYAGPVDRRDAHARRTFLDRPGIQAGDFGLAPPRFALAGIEIVPAAGERDQRRTSDRAKNPQPNATQHARHNARCSVKDCSMMFVPVERRNVLTMMDRCFRWPADWTCRSPATRCAISALIARLKVGHDEYRDEPRSNIVAPSCARSDLSPLLKARTARRSLPISDRGFQMRISETRACLFRIVCHEAVTFPFGTRA